VVTFGQFFPKTAIVSVALALFLFSFLVARMQIFHLKENAGPKLHACTPNPKPFIHIQFPG
jgi:hypothetical protein